MLQAALLPYLHLLIAALTIIVAIALLFWPLLPLWSLRYVPDKHRRVVAGVVALLMVAGLVRHFMAMPKDLVGGLQWRTECVAESASWPDTVEAHDALRTHGLSEIHEVRLHTNERMLPLVHGHLRLVAGIDRWFVTRQLVPRIVSEPTEHSWAGAVGRVGASATDLIYGTIWRHLLPLYAWFSPFLIGLLGVGLALALDAQPAHRRLRQLRADEGPLPLLPTVVGSGVFALVLTLIPFRPVEPPPEGQMVTAVTPVDTPIAELTPQPLPTPSPTGPSEEASDRPIWPETVEVHAYDGRAELRTEPDRYQGETVAWAYDEATLALLERDAVCGPDQGLWLHVRITQDDDERAQGGHRGQQGWVAVQDVTPHRHGCCGDRIYDCGAWPELDPETFEEVELTATEANVRLRSNVRSAATGHARAHNREFRLRTDHPVRIEREVCSPRGYRWAYIRFPEERDGTRFDRRGWVFRPSLTPNADGCCLGRTGADPACRDGVEGF